MKPKVTAFFDEETCTVSYVVAVNSDDCAVIDSVLDYDLSSGRTHTRSADKVIDFVKSNSLKVSWLLETHVHADHLSAAPYLKEKLGGRLAIGAHITQVQETFGTIFNAGSDFARDGSQFDVLLADDEHFLLGEIPCRALYTPGHTPACMTYLIGDAAFVGDTLFMPDYGTARCDFPGGDACQLYRSIQKIFALPDTTRLFLCHDYKAPGRTSYCWESTVLEQKKFNMHIHEGIEEAAFVQMRMERDKQLDMPRLIIPAVQVNMRAGHMPPKESNGATYLKIPLNVF